LDRAVEETYAATWPKHPMDRENTARVIREALIKQRAYGAGQALRLKQQTLMTSSDAFASRVAAILEPLLDNRDHGELGLLCFLQARVNELQELRRLNERL